eukprot:TRINITY_DN7881_c0_g1_i1.p2 TRINITY_DN7881_c0_g1~~TRINITY_DN7881_c0_g1_i1.p2  ORF type:complete len:185 (+),score=31.69 TRINITY_DN7881_c0_g1_i1:42-557(+)
MSADPFFELVQTRVIVVRNPAGKRRVPSSCITLSAKGDVQGGGTGKEYLQNLLDDGDEPWNKWYDAHNSSSSWAEFKLSRAFKIGEVWLKSANDCPERDPEVISFQKQDHGKWITFQERVMPRFSPGLRYEWKKITFEKPQVTNAIRLNIDKVRKEVSGVQLGQVILVETL